MLENPCVNPLGDGSADNVVLARNEVMSNSCHWHAFPPSPRGLPIVQLAIDDLAALSSGNVGAHRGQDARNEGSSGPSSNENNTCIISFVLTLPLTSLSMTRSCWASGNPTGITILPPALS